MLFDGLGRVSPTRVSESTYSTISVSPAAGVLCVYFFLNMASGGGNTCIAGLSTQKISFSSLSSSSNEDDSDTDVYLVSGSEEESDDTELSSSSSDDENISEANIASASQWVQLDVDKCEASLVSIFGHSWQDFQSDITR